MTALLLPIALLLAAAPPLSESQTQRLETAADHTSTADEAALYALLENAARWDVGEASEAGAAVPDYKAILADPQKARGQLFLVEGDLAIILPHEPLARGGWEAAVPLVVRPPAGQPPVVLFLTEPPPLKVLSQTTGEIDEGESVSPPRPGIPVRAPARFLKVVRINNRKSTPTDYLIFVGHKLTKMGEREAKAPFAVTTGGAMLFIVVILLGLFYLLRRRAGSATRVSDYRQQKKQERRALLALGVSEPDTPLPEDPAAAMRALAEERKNRDD